MNVSCVKPLRLSFFGLRWATESSDPVRCRLRGLRAAMLAWTEASGENMVKVMVLVKKHVMSD